MISFKREGSQVVMSVNSNLPVEYPVYPFHYCYVRGRDADAEMLRERLQTEYNRMLQARRRHK